MKYTDIIFDFDGTISDTYPCFTKALLETLREFGLDDDYSHAYALLKISVGRALAAYSFPAPIETVNRRFHEIHERIAIEEQKPYPEARGLLEFISANGGRSYIYSHSGLIVTRLLEKWDMMKYISGILDSRVKLPRKPNPAGLNYMCEKYNLDRSLCLMVGDRDIDTDCARNAGIAGCLFDPEGYYTDTKADYSVVSLDAVKDILK